VQISEQSDPTLNPFRGGKPPPLADRLRSAAGQGLSGRQRIRRMRARHSEGLGDEAGAPPQGCGPMPLLAPLLAVVAFQGDGLALVLVMAADR
jgi:hypothetical protein